MGGLPKEPTVPYGRQEEAEHLRPYECQRSVDPVVGAFFSDGRHALDPAPVDFGLRRGVEQRLQARI